MNERKICFKCKQDKPLIEFRQFKSGKNKGYYQSYCKNCEKEYKLLPWHKVRRLIITRCKNNPIYKNKKVFITSRELKYLWFRDKAYLMKQPSIDRINNDGDYILSNCRFIELKLNQSLGGKIGAKRRWKGER